MTERESASQPAGTTPNADEGSPTVAGQDRRPSWFETLARLWCLKTIPLKPRGSPVATVVLLGSSWLAAWIFIDRWQRQPDPEFYVGGIPLLGWYALAILGLAGLLRGISHPRPTLSATLVLALGLAPVPLLLVSVIAYYLEPSWYRWVCCAAAAYILVYMLRGLRAITGRSQRAAAVMGVIFVATFCWLSDATDAIPDVWNPRERVSPVDDGLAEREPALFEQAGRIDEALDAVHRDASTDPDAFFLGFAGVGEQKVFAQEIELAARTVGKRFGADGRQVSLINDARDLRRAPLASVSGLAYALQGLASRMDLNKDVLFLSLSSHGSPDPVIAVSNSQIPFDDLTRDALTDALRASGIKWRVIIISACYAGGFIDSLRDPKTIVVTAAAADRTSFGCSNDSELTYFGEAFYRDALPGARSLREAFERAKAAIAAREQREHVTPSNPQAYFGAEIEAKLNAMEASVR
ncbi:MAG: C13 family peptidase [Pseudomonadota bacterium]|nr:C13 family peptidase [Pseudomonadota bacterium]